LKQYQAQLAVDARTELGEGPTWDAGRKLLFWVDFLGRQLHAFDPAAGEDRVVLRDRPVSAIAVGLAGGLALACADGLWAYSPENGLGEKLANPEKDKPSVRFNDGKVDPQGFFCVGSLGEKQKDAEGSLYRFGARWQAETLLAGVMLSNGLGWSPDGKTFYYIDTPTLQVRAWDWHAEKGLQGAARLVYQVPPGDGYPDGLAVDAEGMLWVALYLGGKVLRLDSRGGGVLAELLIPGVSRVTCPGFGGEGLDTLYITTAWEHAPDAERKKEPTAGGLFKFKPQVAGLKVSACGLL
jgi:sugar lactone lactonase YvrE